MAELLRVPLQLLPLSLPKSPRCRLEEAVGKAWHGESGGRVHADDCILKVAGNVVACQMIVRAQPLHSDGWALPGEGCLKRSRKASECGRRSASEQARTGEALSE